MKIALIDDDIIFQKLTKIKLRRYDVTEDILSFRDGEEALSFLKKYSAEAKELPDIILLDINMPKMSGWDFMEKFKRMKHQLIKEIKVFMVSSSNNPDDIHKASDNKDLVDYFIKPISDSNYQKLANSFE